VFLSLLKILGILVSVRVIERRLFAFECTHTFCYIVCALALNGFAIARERTSDPDRRSSVVRFFDQLHLSVNRVH
jgi:hypothetical protein